MSIEADVWGALAMLIGLLALIGWTWGIPELTSVRRGWVTTKPATAMFCIVSGGALYNSIGTERRRMIAGPMFGSVALMTIWLGVEAWFHIRILGGGVFAERGPALHSVGAGVPSIGTFLGFLAFGAGGLLVRRGYLAISRWLSRLVLSLGAVAALGYLLNRPRLYWLIEDQSTAMSILTALALISCGLGGLALARDTSTA